MINARLITVSKHNVNSGRVSLQTSDLIDYIEGNMRCLIVVEKGRPISEGSIYEGEDLAQIMASALKNGIRYNKDSNTNYYLADR